MAKVKTTERKPKSKSGTEIDPKIADALASEVERGYDLAKARRLPRLAVAAEQLGYARFGSAEGWTHDAVVLLAQIAGVTSRIGLAIQGIGARRIDHG